MFCKPDCYPGSVFTSWTREGYNKNLHSMKWGVAVRGKIQVSPKARDHTVEETNKLVDAQARKDPLKTCKPHRRRHPK